MKRVTLGLGFAILVVLAVGGCGSNATPSDSPTGSVSSSKKAGSESEGASKQTTLQNFYRGLMISGLMPTVARCFQDRAARLPSHDFNRLMAEGQSRVVIRTYIRRFERSCGVAGETGEERTAGLTAKQVERLRPTVKADLIPTFEKAGASPAQTRCAQDQIDGLSVAELKKWLAAGNGAKSIAGRIVAICKSA